MRPRNKTLLNVLFGTGLYLLDSVRDRVVDGVEDLRGRAQDSYEFASNRVGRASRAIRGEGHSVSTATAALIGLGIGVGIGFLLAPASGEETRRTIAGKAGYYGGKVKERFSKEMEPGSGTYGA